MPLIPSFFAGMFFANGLPHFIKGITGQTHMTPFKRVSDSYTNVIWAFVNFVIALLILGIDIWGLVIGALAMSLMCAWLFSNPNAKLPWHKD